MGEKEAVIWGIHAGRTGEADAIFLRKNYVAIGWSQMGDLRNIKGDLDAYKAKVSECYPEKKRGAISPSRWKRPKSDRYLLDSRYSAPLGGWRMNQ